MRWLLNLLKGRRQRRLEARYLDRARSIWMAEGVVEIHDNARVNTSEHGAWVAAWVWVGSKQLPPPPK